MLAGKPLSDASLLWVCKVYFYAGFLGLPWLWGFLYLYFVHFDHPASQGSVSALEDGNTVAGVTRAYADSNTTGTNNNNNNRKNDNPECGSAATAIPETKRTQAYLHTTINCAPEEEETEDVKLVVSSGGAYGRTINRHLDGGDGVAAAAAADHEDDCHDHILCSPPPAQGDHHATSFPRDEGLGLEDIKIGLPTSIEEARTLNIAPANTTTTTTTTTTRTTGPLDVLEEGHETVAATVPSCLSPRFPPTPGTGIQENLRKALHWYVWWSRTLFLLSVLLFVTLYFGLLFFLPASHWLWNDDFIVEWLAPSS